MTNTSKTIDQYGEKTLLENNDTFLLQRGNFYYSVKAKNITSGALIETTYASAQTSKGADALSRGATYYLTDKYIYLLALGVNIFDLSGVYLTRNADFQSNGNYTGITIANGFTVNATGTNLGVWTTALAPASGDVAIWNNKHWLNITGSNGATNPSVDGVNWEAVANTDVDVANTYGYIYEYDAIEYDFDNDTINRRVDARSNDIATNTISIFQWGNDNVYSNTVMNEAYFTIQNQLGSVYNNTILSNAQIVASTGTTVFRGNTILTPVNLSIVATKQNLFYDYTGYNIEYMYIAGELAIREFYPVANISGETIIGRDSTLQYDIELVATAYAGGTTYSFGDFATSGTVTYMYINSASSSGNAPPNATYWVEVYDFTTAGRYKLTISRYFNSAGVFNLISSNATETIDEIVISATIGSLQYLEFICETGLAVTFDNTVYGSLANEGEILASGNIVVDGDKEEFVVFDVVDVGGTDYMRERYSQTGIA